MKKLFQPGNKGRPKGARNKSLTRAKIQAFVNENWNTFESQLKGLKGRAFVENFLKLLPYITPAYSSINFSLQNMTDEDLEFLVQKLKETHTHDTKEADLN